MTKSPIYPRFMRWRRVCHAISLICIICAAMNLAPPLQSPALADEIAAPKRAHIVGPGRVEPESGEVDIAVELPGILEQVNVHEGDNVQSGQLLANLRNGDQKQRVLEAEAQLSIKQAIYDKLSAGARQEDIDQATASLVEAENSLKLSFLQLNRQKNLRKGGYTAQSALDEAQSTYDQAASRKAAAAAALALLKNGTRKEDLIAARADVDLAAAQLQEAKLTLEKSILRAPFDATVLRRYKDPGASVTGSATPILQVGNLAKLLVRVQIDEADIAPIHTGLGAEIRVPAYPDRVFTGKVVRMSPRLGTKTISTDAPTEKRDARVLDTMIALDPGQSLPVGIRVDCYININ